MNKLNDDFQPTATAIGALINATNLTVTDLPKVNSNF
jgi:hypothetical protein